MKKMLVFDIYNHKHHHIDTVFYTVPVTEKEVEKSLIEHDGYEPGILAIQRGKK